MMDNMPNCENAAIMIVPMIKNQIMNPMAKAAFMLLSSSILQEGQLKLSLIVRRRMPLLQLGQVLMIVDVVRCLHKDAMLSRLFFWTSTTGSSR
jgi:hypothetical protein